MLYKLFQICEKHNIEFYASLERIMRCGCGLCGLCAIDPTGLLVCKDGPIFSCEMLRKMDDFGKFARDFTWYIMGFKNIHYIATEHIVKIYIHLRPSWTKLLPNSAI